MRNQKLFEKVKNAGNEMPFRCSDEIKGDSKQHFLVKNKKLFEKLENAGSEITFYCSKYRSCKLCKEHYQSEILSERKEVSRMLSTTLLRWILKIE